MPGFCASMLSPRWLGGGELTSIGFPGAIETAVGRVMAAGIEMKLVRNAAGAEQFVECLRPRGKSVVLLLPAIKADSTSDRRKKT